ncbi:hypothetical protein RRG08_021213 [Elysia crispata]|uniref:Uncharacterized protein n=1 Tax=Elysia crispata TaxID=231223 RepID=A0AAE0ZA60_9GAST|nr:hypothetical protein RRG08_021213 [Elysia crispata]
MLLRICTIYSDTGHQAILSSTLLFPSIRTLVIKQSHPPSSQVASQDMHHLFGHWSSSNLILNTFIPIYSDTGHQAISSSIFSSCFSGYAPSIRTLVIKQSYPQHFYSHLFGHWSSSNLILNTFIPIYSDTGHQAILSSTLLFPSIRTLVIKQSYPPSSQAASPDIHHLFGHWSSSNLILHFLKLLLRIFTDVHHPNLLKVFFSVVLV